MLDLTCIGAIAAKRLGGAGGWLAAIVLGLGLAAGVAHAAETGSVPEDILRTIEEVVGLPSEVSPSGLNFSLNSPDGIYREGDFAVFNVTAPDYDGYLYLDYYQIDGNVVHILPDPDSADVKVKRGNSLTIGSPESDISYEIFPPFGRELLVLMASPQPLFDEPRREFEDAGVYLEALQDGISRLARGAVPGALAVIYRAIQTHSKDAVIAEAPRTPDRPAVAPAEPASQAAPAPEAAPVAETTPVVTEPPVPLPASPPTQAAAAVAPDRPAEPEPPQPQAQPPQEEPAPDIAIADSPPMAKQEPAATVIPLTQAVAPDRTAAAPGASATGEAAATQTAALPAMPAAPSSEETRLRQRIGDLLKRMQQAPNDTENLVSLVETYQDYAQQLVQRGDYDKATRSLAMAMALDPTNADLAAYSRDVETTIAIRQNYDQGLSLLTAGDADLAYESFQRVLALDPDHAEARQRVADITPEVTEIYHKKALTAFRRQDLDRALEIWDKVLAIDPDHQKARLNRLLALDLKERLQRLQSQ